jgi:Rrf2 family protein
MLSAKARYGLKAVFSLALETQPRAVVGAELAAREKIPKKFLEQILLELKHRGLLQTKRGRHGGYLLTRSPSEITVGQVIRALDGPLAPIPCVSLTAYVKSCDDCRDETACGVRLVMKQVRDATARIVDNTTLADVARMIATASSGVQEIVLSVSPGATKRPTPSGRTVKFRGPRGTLER